MDSSMCDTITEVDAQHLLQAVQLRKASHIANAVFLMENVMNCLKNLLLEQSGVKEEFGLNLNTQAFGSQAASHENPQKLVNCLPNSHTPSVQGPHIGTDMSELMSGAAQPSVSQKLHTMSQSNSRGDPNMTVRPDPTKRLRPVKFMAASPVDKTLTCEKCGYQTMRKDHFDRHQRSHTADKPFKCQLCTFSCRDAYHLRRHLNSSVHTAKQKESLVMPEILSCDMCNYTTTQRARLERHSRIHSGEKPFACDRCTYKAAQRSTLERHILTHTGEKPFKCAICEYCAADTKSLKFHMLQKHGNEDVTVHQCPHCPYSTPVDRYFKLHMRAHSDARPYLCDICGYSAKRPHGLTKHYRTMHGWSKEDTDGKEWLRHPLDTETDHPPLSAANLVTSNQQTREHNPLSANTPEQYHQTRQPAEVQASPYQPEYTMQSNGGAYLDSGVQFPHPQSQPSTSQSNIPGVVSAMSDTSGIVSPHSAYQHYMTSPRSGT